MYRYINYKIKFKMVLIFPLITFSQRNKIIIFSETNFLNLDIMLL